MTPEDPLLKLLERFRQEGVEFVLIGGQAVRLNGSHSRAMTRTKVCT